MSDSKLVARPAPEAVEKAREMPSAADYLVAANVVARFNQDASPSTLSMRRRVLLGDLVAEAVRDARVEERERLIQKARTVVDDIMVAAESYDRNEAGRPRESLAKNAAGARAVLTELMRERFPEAQAIREGGDRG